MKVLNFLIDKIKCLFEEITWSKFLIDQNIIKKLLFKNIKNKDVVEIGPGNGALTDKILYFNPSSLIVIEKDIFIRK